MINYKKILKTYFIHNIFGHPIMEILNSVGKREWADFVHDYTLPKEGVDKKGTANTEDDAPEVNRTTPTTKD